jgi:hypothetical protein
MWVHQCKIFFPLSLTSTSANYIASTNYYHCGRPDDSVVISLDTRGNNMADDMEPVLQEPLKLVVVHGRAATTPYGKCTKS